jgi:hypothetical protein
MGDDAPSFPKSPKQALSRNRWADHGPLIRMAFGFAATVALLAACTSSPATSDSNAPVAPAASIAPPSAPDDLTGFGATPANFVGGSDIHFEPGGMDASQILIFTINSSSGTTFDQALTRAKELLPPDVTSTYDSTQAICRQIVFSSNILEHTALSDGSGMLGPVLVVLESGPSSGLPYDAADISATTMNFDPNGAVPGPCM